MKGVTTSYHSWTKWTHPLIIDMDALSQHFIVSYVPRGMTQSVRRSEIKDGAKHDSHFDIPINTVVSKKEYKLNYHTLLKQRPFGCDSM